jgi:hypothetical protein
MSGDARAAGGGIQAHRIALSYELHIGEFSRAARRQ